MIKIQILPFNPLETNCYVVYDEQSLEAVIVDPSCMFEAEFEKLYAFVEDKKLLVKAVVATHPHFDHICGSARVCEKYDLPLWIGEGGESFATGIQRDAACFRIRIDPACPNLKIFKEDGEKVTFGNHALKVLLTPGHCPGSVSYVEESTRNVIVGDVIFRESIGRTDFEGGDLDVLRDSIHRKLFRLGDDYTIRPGHGGRTTVGYERENNPFL